VSVTEQNEPALDRQSLEEELDLRELFSVFWSNRRLIVGAAIGSGLISVAVAVMQPNIYTASALLAPAEQTGSEVGGLMRQYGGLASLAGISLPGGGEGSRTQLGIHLLKSRAFVAGFIERRNLLPTLMAVHSWNSDLGELKFDASLFNEEQGVWLPKDEGKYGKPSQHEAYKAFMSKLSVSQNKQTSYVTVTFEHQSPIVAANITDWLVQDVNSAVKEQDVREALRSIQYLHDQVEKTALADLQAIFFELIQSQTERVMLAEVRPEYVFKVIDPAVVPEEKSAPSRAIICIIGTLLGTLLVLCGVLVRHYMWWRK